MNISKKQILGIGLMAAIASVQANAKDFSYTYVEGGFADVDIDNNDADYIYGGGSLALDRNIFIRGSLGNLDVDRVSEFDTVSIGVGHPMKMSERSDLVLAMDYSFAEADRGNADIDTLTGSAMTRTWLTNNVEGNLMGGLAYQDADYGGSDTGAIVGAGIRVYVVPQFSVGANISRSFIGDLDTDEIGLNARLQF
ncbi:outer membrane beta-barrel protein [Zhongshania borealis]|uniref:Outer membrane protein beta-barrel domain-containing protein n=1 Tax=Zhongshania borealis TaxID=889488 RepID=A0ABP7X7F3_9GAMM